MCSLLLLIVCCVIERARASVAGLPVAAAARNVEAENVDLSRGQVKKERAVWVKERMGFCPREQLLSVPYATFPFSLMQTDWRNSAVHLGWSRAVSLLFLAADSRDTASFCFPKLIQPDSPAALNHRDDLRLGAALPPPLNFPRVYTHPPTAFCSLARSLWR